MTSKATVPTALVFFISALAIGGAACGGGSTGKNGTGGHADGTGGHADGTGGHADGTGGHADGTGGAPASGSSGGQPGTGGVGTGGAAADAGHGGNAPTGGAGGTAAGTGGTATGAGGIAAGTGGTVSGGGGTSANAGTICPAGPYAASPIPSPAPTPQAICSGLSFVEGAVWFSSLKALLFSNFRSNETTSNFNGDIMRYVPGGQCETFIQNSGSNGLAIGPQGQILAAVHVDESITSIDPTTKIKTVLVPNYMEMHFSSPNDLTVHDNGTIYFTDPNYQLGSRQMALPEAAYRRDPNGTVTIIDVLTKPNGITLSPDQKRLYVAITGGIRLYDVDNAGVPTNGRMFITTGSDGMTVDCAGNLYVTNNGVQVFNPAGTRLGTLTVQGSTTNVAFGGDDRKTLFITAGTRVYTVALNIPGYPY